MSKAQYGEPWTWDGEDMRGSDGNVLESSDEFAYRAVACVSALAGVPDPAAFVRSHAELLAALEGVLGLATQSWMDERFMPKEITAARAAILNAKGTT